MASTRAALTIAAANLRRQARDRTALFFVALLPVAIILIIGVTVASEDDLAVGVTVPPGELASALVDTLEANESLAVQHFDDADGVRGALRRSEIFGGLVIPRDYDAALRTGRPVTLEFLVDPASLGGGSVRAAVNAAVAEQTAVIEAGRFAESEVGGTLIEHRRVAQDLARVLPPIGVGERLVGGGDGEDAAAGLPSRFTYTAPTNLVLFVFITSLSAAALLIETRRLGVSRRMLAGPVRARTVLAGETLARYLVALLQGLFILGVGWVLFGVNWGDPVAALTIIAVFSLVGTAAAMLMGSMFSTPQQAGSLGPFIGIALGMLGGCMWPLEIVPRPMQVLGHFTPHAWAVDAFLDVVSGASLGDVAGQVAIVGAFAAVLLPLAAWRLHRAVVA